MEYRKMKNGYQPSLLGFGCMRFPLNDDGNIHEEEAEKMIDMAIQQGVTYIDTAFPYHNGDSEPFVGRVLKKYDRSSFSLATKLPLWKIETLEDVKQMFENQLQRLDVDYVDFYLLHALDKEKWEKAKRLGVIEYCEQLKKEGKIRNFGFSFHDAYDVFEEIIKYRDWDFCQIQYNYVDRRIQAGDQGYELAASLKIPMVIMEPVKGGSLAKLPEDIAQPLKAYAPDKSISSWALRWVGSHANVKVILSGMSTMEQVEDNIKTFANFQPLNETERELMESTAKQILDRTRNGCTGCAYCMPCPFGVDIPRNFKIWNEYAKYGNEDLTRKQYDSLKEEEKASNCKKCGKCETLCPQVISIRKNLEEVKEEMNRL